MSFLSKNIIGLDIADFSIEVVESNYNKITKKARKELAPGIVESGRIKSQEKLTEAVSSIFQEAKIKNFSNKKLIFGLPESQTFIHIFDNKDQPAQAGKKENIENAVKDELHNNIPLDYNVVAYGFTKSNKQSRIVCLTTERSVLVEWKKFLESFGFADISMAAETFASYVGLGIKNEKLPIAVVDIGSVNTMVSIYDSLGACFASSIKRAGDFLTKKIVVSSGLSSVEAEKEKCENGLNSTNEKVTTSLKQGLNNIVSDVKGIIQYGKEKCGVEISNIILIGGTSQMPGLADYFKAQIGLDISIGTSPYVSDKTNLLYIESVGLALYEKNKQQLPLFDHGLSEEKKVSKKIIKKDDSRTLTSSNEESADNYAEGDYAGVKTKKQIIIFLVILLVGVVSVSLAFWYRSGQDKKHQADLASKTQNFTFVTTFPLSVPVAVDLAEQTKDRVTGRIINDKIQIMGTKDEAVQTSRIVVDRQLIDGEVLWQAPLAINSSTSKGNIVAGATDYAIQWLIYNESSANNLFTNLASAQIQNRGVNYSISNIEKNGVEKTENKNIYILSGIVSIATDKQVNISP